LIQRPNTVDEIKTRVKFLFNHPLGGDIVPYALIQPRLRNRIEYKVVLNNGVALFCWKRGSVGKSFSSSPHDQLFKFAEEALKLLKRNCPATIHDGLIRVDVMIADDGRPIVNEFESFEACYFTTKSELEAQVYTFLEHYWLLKINKLIAHVKNKFKS
jgi:hypothetical protein